MARRVFVDAMNVIRCNLLLARFEDDHGSVAAGRELLRLVGGLAQRVGGHTEWIVVFDGPSDEGAPADADGLVLAVFGEGRSADEIIVERVEDALAVGHEAVIVSNDTDVRVEGASDMSSQEFYDGLVSLPPPVEKQIPGETYEDQMQSRAAQETAGKADALRGLLARLVELGHLPAAAAGDVDLARDLAREIERGRAAHLPLQKIAKQIESFFRKRMTVAPDPDPQRSFFRAVKEGITKQS